MIAIIINIVISKLEFIPKHYKIIRNKNIIVIKCHYYFNDWMFNYLSNNIIKHNQNDNTYSICYGNINKKLNNFNYSKIFNLTIIDIIIDLNNKNYKIITSYFPIIYCNYDINILYNKLNSKLYYIEINNLYDNYLNFYDNHTENTFNKNSINYRIPSRIPNYYISNNIYKFDRLITNKNKSISIIIKNDNDNDNDNIIINSSFYTSDGIDKCHPNYNISDNFETLPHIFNNSIGLNKISGYFI